MVIIFASIELVCLVDRLSLSAHTFSWLDAFWRAGVWYPFLFVFVLVCMMVVLDLMFTTGACVSNTGAPLGFVNFEEHTAGSCSEELLGCARDQVGVFFFFFFFL